MPYTFFPYFEDTIASTSKIRSANQDVSLTVNPLLPELVFPSILETLPKIGSYHLPTHRLGAHRIFFNDPIFFLNRNFG